MRLSASLSALFIATALHAQPANDDCYNATLLTVRQAGQCPGLSTLGDNGNATQSGIPACSDSASTYKDVWYNFNSGASTEITVYFTFVSIDEWGIELLDGCTGNSVFCDSTSAAQYVMPVSAGTNYVIRIFTSSILNSGGSFTICLTGNGVLAACDAGVVTTDTGLDSVIICQDSVADVIGFSSSTGSGEPFTFIVLDEEDTIVAVGLGPWDFDLLPLGTYYVIGVSYNGSLIGAQVGTSINSVSSSGTCIDIGTNGTIVQVDICQGVAADGPVPEWIIATASEPGSFVVRAPSDVDRAEVLVLDLAGRELQRSSEMFAQGSPTLVRCATGPGIRLVQLRWKDGVIARPVFVR